MVSVSLFIFFKVLSLSRNQTAAKQKGQTKFGIRISRRTLGKRERKRGKGPVVERQPWVQSGRAHIAIIYDTSAARG